MAEISFTALEQDWTVNYNYGENIHEAVELFGEEAVFSLFAAKADIWVQDFGRARIKAGDTLEQVQAKLDARKIGVVTRSKKDPVASFLAGFSKMKPEDQLRILQQMKDQAAAAEAA